MAKSYFTFQNINLENFSNNQTEICALLRAQIYLQKISLVFTKRTKRIELSQVAFSRSKKNTFGSKKKSICNQYGGEKNGDGVSRWTISMGQPRTRAWVSCQLFVLRRTPSHLCRLQRILYNERPRSIPKPVTKATVYS